MYTASTYLTKLSLLQIHYKYKRYHTEVPRECNSILRMLLELSISKVEVSEIVRQDDWMNV